MKYRSKILLISLLVLSHHFTKAQSEIPLKLSLITEQVSLPTLQNHGAHFGHGFSLGGEYLYSKKSKIALIQTADFYFYSHQSYGASLVVASLFDFRYSVGNFNMDLKLGPGYMLFDNYSPVYQSDNGQYIKASRLQSKFSEIQSVAFSYQIQNFKPFISYDLLVEMPFINSNSIILPHQILQAGCYFNLFTQKNEK